jgi:electron transfer flavoprotein alpha subunit
MARLGAVLATGVAAGCTAVARDADGRWLVRRPVQGGKAYAEQAASGEIALATVRPNTFALPEAAGAAPAVELWGGAGGVASGIENAGFEATAGGRVPLEEASVVVAGGRGVGSEEDFALVEQLADALGGAVGASRAVVDARWRPVEEQVGKSGRTVAPALYFAVGISGAIHHTMGMDTAGVVVAINNDPNALMFQAADYGLVGDARQVLPALIERLKG